MPVPPLVSLRRLRLLAGFVGVQFAVQALGFVVGLVVVRTMAPAEFGMYTLALSLVGVAGVVMELGLGSAALASGGALHADRDRLGELMVQALTAQRHLAALAGLPLLGLGLLLLGGQGLPRAIGLTALALACAALHAGNAVALSAWRLRGEVARQQRLDLAIQAARLAGVLALSLLWLDAASALLLNALAAALTAWLLQRGEPAAVADLRGPTPSTDHRPALWAQVRRHAPNALYHCFATQIAVWTVGWLGSSERVAQVGALGRLAVIFTVIGAGVAAIVQPWFARQQQAAALRSGLAAMNVFFVGLGALLAGLAAWQPGPLLWLLGPAYAPLRAEVPWMVLASTLAAWGGALYAAGCARGWVLSPAVVITGGLATIIGAALLCDMASVRGAYQLNTATAAFGVLSLLVYLQGRLRAMTTGHGG